LASRSKGRPAAGRLTAALAGLLALSSVASLCVGRYSAGPLDLVRAFGPEGGALARVLLYVRLPRILAALLVGAGLSVSGAVYQSVFRNPLVSPDLLGVASGASFGAALALAAGAPFGAAQVSAFIFGLAAVGLASLLPRAVFKNASNLTLVLSGIIVSGFMSSLLGLLKFLADERTSLASIVFWQMGSLAQVKYHDLALVALPMLSCLALLCLLAWRLNLLALGEEEARTLGAPVGLLRGLCVACASLLTACAVSVSGTIGWIGLVIPHMSRLVAGPDNARAVPASLLLGALFLLVIDTASRTATTMELPLSILTGLVGAPCYAWLLYRQRLAAW